MLWTRPTQFQRDGYVAQGRVATVVLGLSRMWVELLYKMSWNWREKGHHRVSFPGGHITEWVHRFGAELIIARNLCILVKMWTKASLHFEGFSLRLIEGVALFEIGENIVVNVYLGHYLPGNLLTWSDQENMSGFLTELIVVHGTYVSEQGFKV